jgi:hypothetical protein
MYMFWMVFQILLRILCRPDIKLFCDLHYDPFLVMQDQNKVYGEPCRDIDKTISDVLCH